MERKISLTTPDSISHSDDHFFQRWNKFHWKKRRKGGLDPKHWCQLSHLMFDSMLSILIPIYWLRLRLAPLSSIRDHWSYAQYNCRWSHRMSYSRIAYQPPTFLPISRCNWKSEAFNHYYVRKKQLTIKRTWVRSKIDTSHRHISASLHHVCGKTWTHQILHREVSGDSYLVAREKKTKQWRAAAKISFIFSCSTSCINRSIPAANSSKKGLLYKGNHYHHRALFCVREFFHSTPALQCPLWMLAVVVAHILCLF